MATDNASSAVLSDTAGHSVVGMNRSAEALRVFISYSRRDVVVADNLVTALEDNGFLVVIDRRDLPYGEEWQKELSSLIAESDTVVWLVSPASIASDWCNWELGEVGRLSKRLVPVKVREIEPATLPKALGRIHLLPASGIYKPANHEADLVRTLNIDRAWLKRATSLGEDAREWVRNGREASRLLRGAELSEAEQWSLRPPQSAPAPPSEILELILASRNALRLQQRNTVIGSLAAALVAIALSGVAVWFGLEARRQTAEAEAQRVVAEAQRKEAVKRSNEAEEQRAIAAANELKAKEQEAEARYRRDEALRQTGVARLHESAALSALSGVETLQRRPVEAVKLALAAWPRRGAENAPRLERNVRQLAAAFEDFHERGRIVATDPILHADMTGDLRFILTLSTFGRVVLWDSHSGEFARSLPSAKVASANYSFDGKYVITGDGERGTASIWSTSNGELVVVFAAGWGDVFEADLSPDGNGAVTSHSDGSVRFWDIGTRSLLSTLTVKGKSLRRAKYSHSGDLIVAFTDDGASVWDTKTGKLRFSLPHKFALSSATFSDDDALVVTTSADGVTRLWDGGTGELAVELPNIGGWATSAAFSPDRNWVATAHENGLVGLWDATTGRLLGTLPGHSGWVQSVKFISDDRLITASNDSTIRMWDVSSPVQLQQLGDGTGGSLTSADYSPDGKWIATGSASGWVRLIEVGTRKEFRFQAHQLGDLIVKFSTNGERLLTVSADRTAQVWNFSDRQNVLTLVGHHDAILDGSFSSDGSRIVTASADKTVRVWDARTGEQLLNFRNHRDAVRVATFSPDGTRVLTASDYSSAIIFDAVDGSVVTLLPAPRSAIRAAIFSPDGTQIAAYSEDGSVVVWDEGARVVRQRLQSVRPNLSAVAFSPDGSRIAGTAAQGDIWIWDVSTGALLKRLYNLGNVISSVKYSPTGRELLTASYDALVRTWDVSQMERGSAFEIACQRLGNDTALMDVQETYSLSALAPICGYHPPERIDWSKLQ